MMTKNKGSFAFSKERLKEARRKLGLTQEELGALLGITFSTVCRWENGKHQPSPIYVKHLESFLNKKLKVKKGDRNAKTK